MTSIVTIDEAVMELDADNFIPYLRFSGLLDLSEIPRTEGDDPFGVITDRVANSIGHEILRQARFLYELSKDA